MADVGVEVGKLLATGKSQNQIRYDLEAKGFSTDDIAHALSHTTETRTTEERKNSFWLSAREVFDRVGYGGAPPQFINILFWLSQQANPFILPLIGILHGLKTIVSVFWSSIMQEYSKLQRVSKNTIAQGGIVFGFSFLFMAFGLLLHNNAGLWIFAASFLLGTIGFVAYGDLYQKFVHETIRKERMGSFLRSIATWGVLITAGTLIISGYLLDMFPMTGIPWTLSMFGQTYHLKVYGFLLSFEITAFALIIAGYVSSLITDKREDRTYKFGQFLGEYLRIIKTQLSVFADTHVLFLAFGMLVSGFLQIIITSYSGLAIYKLLTDGSSSLYTTYPFFTLAIIYAVAIIASFTGPFFTKSIHRSTGLAPTLVFGSLLMAVLPLVLVYNPNIVTITASLCVYVIGASVTGFGQGLLAQKLMPEETRRGYFQAQAFVMIIPYLVLTALLAWGAYTLALNTLFLIAAAGMIIIVMPTYFTLVLISQKIQL